jgi:hypothetical protein
MINMVLIAFLSGFFINAAPASIDKVTSEITYETAYKLEYNMKRGF